MAESSNPVDDLGRTTISMLMKLTQITSMIYSLKHTQIEENGVATEVQILINALTSLNKELNNINHRLQIRCALEGLPYERSGTSAFALPSTSQSTFQSGPQLQSSLPTLPASAALPTNISLLTPPQSPVVSSPSIIPLSILIPSQTPLRRSARMTKRRAQRGLVPPRVSEETATYTSRGGPHTGIPIIPDVRQNDLVVEDALWRK